MAWCLVRNACRDVDRLPGPCDSQHGRFPEFWSMMKEERRPAGKVGQRTLADTRACIIFIQLTHALKPLRPDANPGTKANCHMTTSQNRNNILPFAGGARLICEIHCVFSATIYLLSRTLALTPSLVAASSLVGARCCAHCLPKLLFLQGLHCFFHHRPFTLAKAFQTMPFPLRLAVSKGCQHRWQLEKRLSNSYTPILCSRMGKRAPAMCVALPSPIETRFCKQGPIPSHETPAITFTRPHTVQAKTVPIIF